jgi:hypothetical protein
MTEIEISNPRIEVVMSESVVRGSDKVALDDTALKHGDAFVMVPVLLEPI